jgi:4-diphosphocytidyl-2-C-methyl-D-erythritol kinase
VRGAAGVEVEAHAKVNLHLRVLERRPDGYHDVETLLASVGTPRDRVRLRKSRRPGVTLTLSQAAGTAASPGMPADPEENLAVRAARAYLCAIGATESAGLSIALRKEIPVGGGLGGGSADAAAALAAANVLFGRPLDAGALARVACGLGSDVPFCLTGGLAAATGRGDRLEFLTCAHPLHVVVVTPPLPVSTAWAYEALDAWRAAARPRSLPPAAEGAPAPLRGVVERLLAAGPPGLAGLAINDFEPVVLPAHEVCRRARDAMLGSGAAWALLSGSGASVFGVFADAGSAAAAAARLRASLGADHRIHG